MNWVRLSEVHNLAKQAMVSWELCYSEPDDSWYFWIKSPAPSERAVTRSAAFDSAIDYACDWLREIIGRGLGG